MPGRTSAITAPQQQALQSLAQLAVQENYQKAHIPVLDGGFRTDVQGDALQDNQSPFMLNVILQNNQIIPDTGYGAFGTVLTPFYGKVQLPWQVFYPTGQTQILLVTTKTVYIYMSQYGQWQLVPFGNFYTNTGSYSAGTTSITLTSVAGLTVGHYLGIPFTDGEQLPVQITGIVGSNVVFTPAIPSGHTLANASNIVSAAFLAGNLTDQVAITDFPPKGWTIISNQNDPLFYFDGTKLTALPTQVVNTTCTQMVVFHESLFLLGTVENGTAFPQRVRMSDIGDPTAWTPGLGTSIAAIYDLLDTEDFLHQGTVLGPYLILYRETTIMRGTYLGLLNNTMFWEYVVFSEGVISTVSVSEIGALQQFCGNGDIYTYDGSYQLEGVGSAVFLNVLSAIGEMNAAAKDSVFSQYNPDYDEFWLFYPAGVSTVPNVMMRQSLEKGGWFRREFANTFVSASPVLPIASQTWQTWPGTWAQQTLPWVSRAFLANVSSILFASTDTNLIYLYDYKAQTDGGVPINWRFQTKDIGMGDMFVRFDSMRLYGTGNVMVEYSTDGGDTFQLYGVGALDLGTKPSLGILTKQVTSQYIRLQFSGSDPAFSFRWCEVWYIPESEW